MKTYWLAVLAIALADAALGVLLLVRDGGPENLVWWTFLIIPLIIAGLVVIGLVLQIVR